jgi:hypothetical protein
MQLLDGKATAAQIRLELADAVKKRKQEGKKIPHLAAILVGNDPSKTPTLDLSIGHQGFMPIPSQWASNAPYVQGQLRCALLTAPKLFDYLNECFRYSNWNSVNLLRLLPTIPIDVKLDDNEIYKIVGLTDEEISHINTIIQWR